MTTRARPAVADPTDPLGRIAAQAAQPYDHPEVRIMDLERYWQVHFAAWARGLTDDELQRAHAEAVAAVTTCEADLQAGWDSLHRRREEAMHRYAALMARLPRLVGTRDALAAEIAWREERYP